MTLQQLKCEIAAILVRLENGRVDDAKEMCVMLVSEQAVAIARADFAEEFGE